MKKEERRRLKNGYFVCGIVEIVKDTDFKESGSNVTPLHGVCQMSFTIQL